MTEDCKANREVRGGKDMFHQSREMHAIEWSDMHVKLVANVHGRSVEGDPGGVGRH